MSEPSRDPTSRWGRAEVERKITGAICAALAIGERDIQAEGFVLSGSKAFSSFSLLELILRLEDAFQIDIPDDHLERDRFDSLRAIADYVEHRLGESGAA